MNTGILRHLFIILLNFVLMDCFAREIVVESFEEKIEDLTANTQPVMDLNNVKCALIKVSIPEKATFEGNIIKSEYKTNEYYVYVSPGTKKITLKYPDVETLVIPLSDYLGGSGVASGRTYRLKLNGVPVPVPEVTILIPDTKVLIDSLARTGELDSLAAIHLKPEYVWKPNKVIIKAYADVGLGNALSMESAIPLSLNKASATNFGLDFGFYAWQNEKNNLTINVGVGYMPINLKLNASDLSYGYNASAAADMDGNTYIRYYDVNTLNQEIKSALVTIPVYLGYTYNIKNWLGFYLNVGASLGFKSSSKLDYVSGEGFVYGVYPEYEYLKIEESYLNGFGNMNLGKVDKQPGEMKGFTSSILLGAGLEGRISGPLWINVGLKYNLGLNNLYTGIYEPGQIFTEQNAPLTYLVKGGEQVKPLTDYLVKSKLSMFSLNIGLCLKF